jgi:putative ABC transport system permease protein
MFQDLRFGFRQFLKRPVWTASIILVLAIGTGANTAMFSAFETWALRPLDFPEPDRLVSIDESRPKLGITDTAVSPMNLGDWMLQQQSFEGLAAFRRHRFNLNDDYEPVRLSGAQIAEPLFPLLGKKPVLGRGFTEEDDQPNQPAPVALISDHLWHTRFDGKPEVIGRTIRLDGHPHVIVGVMEPGFKFPELAEVWTPLGMDTQSGNRGDRYLSVVGRLRSGISLEDARHDIKSIAGRLETLYPEANRGFSAEVIPLREEWAPPVIRTALMASLSSGIFVLLIICANVASLMLAHASGRSREVAIRTALGAGRKRLVSQSLLEGILLALPAGLIGIGLGILVVRSMTAYIPVEPPYLFQMEFSPVTGIYTLAVAVFAGVICGLASVARHSGLRISEALKSGGERESGPSTGGRLRRVLVIGELALSTSLLIGALLMVKSFIAMQSVDRGYRTDGIITAEVSLFGEGLDKPEERVAIIERLTAKLRDIPRVDRVGVSSQLPASQSNRIWGLVAQGRPYEPGEDVRAMVHGVAGDYLETLEIPLTSGRTFTAGEIRNGGKVAIVSQGLAEQLWGSVDPMGRQFRAARGPEEEWLTVVGVVGDVDYGRDLVIIGQFPEVQMYLPYRELPSNSMAMVIQTKSPPEQTAPAMRSAIREAAPGVPLSEILTMDDSIFRVRWVSNFFSRQLAVYALLATAIAALGLYGLTADSVGRRKRELAIRVAVGADRRDLIRLIVKEALFLGGVGVALGILMASAMTRFGSQILIGVSATDPVVFSAVSLLLLAVTVVAAYVPAQRATALDPTPALRAE